VDTQNIAENRVSVNGLFLLVGKDLYLEENWSDRILLFQKRSKSVSSASQKLVGKDLYLEEIGRIGIFFFQKRSKALVLFRRN
jgi:hypothetical protein